jgi:phosphocarrier protein HPr
MMASRTSENGQVPRDSVPPSPGSPAPNSAQDGTTGPLRKTVRIINPLGLHHRAADRFSRAAKRFTALVSLWNGELRANGKDLWDLMLLAVLPETEVILEVEGEDAATAIESLADILAAASGEDYTI